MKREEPVALQEQKSLLTSDPSCPSVKRYSRSQSRDDKEGCGLSLIGWRPGWSQGLASTKCFLIVYGLLGTIQSMTYVYFVATLTTLERRFKIPSSTTGLMLSGNEISQILLALLLTYYGGQRNRPVWIAWGVACSALSCFILAMPHFLYGPGSIALSLTKEYIASHHINQSVLEHRERMGLCHEEVENECAKSGSGEYSIVPPLLVFLSQFILGIGTTLYYSLGQTYIDDNTKKKNTPLLLGCTMSLRTFGPIFGFLIGYACLNLYIAPELTPLIDKKDPRWLGAWWLGWLIAGSVMMIFAFIIAMFPKNLRPSSKKAQAIGNGICIIGRTDDNQAVMNGKKERFSVSEPDEVRPPTLKEFPIALRRLIQNKLLVINIFSAVFYILGAAGYITYLTKYLEVQFNKTAASANIVTGPATLLSMVLGFLISGLVISKFQPRAKYLLGWNVFVGSVYVIGELILAFVSCENYHLVGYNPTLRSTEFMNTCNMNCGCENVKFAPVCFEETGLTFYSACHAGCHNVSHQDSFKMFDSCECIPSKGITVDGLESLGKYEYIRDGMQVKEGTCPSECGYNFILFVVLVAVMNSLGSSGKIGNILVNYRAVSPGDKSFAQGLSLLIISLLAFIPGPILFGFIIDSTCVIWDESCGTKGNCWVYDKTTFRHRVNFTASGVTLIGVILDIIVCYLGKDLNLYSDETEEKQNQRDQVKS